MRDADHREFIEGLASDLHSDRQSFGSATRSLRPCPSGRRWLEASIRYRGQIRWAWVFDWKSPGYSVRKRYDKQEQQQHLGITEVVSEQTGDHETRKSR